VALKQIAKADLSSSKQVGRVHTEKDILSKMNHPLVVKFFGCFQDLENLYIGLEFMPGGDLYGWLAKRVTLNTAETRFYAAEIAAVLFYIHKQGIVYRDLKAENILIGSNGHIKLTDFGLAKKLLPGERTFSLCGTPQCMAPEVITKSGHNYEVDWWSFGILLHEMITGHSPFDAPSAYEVYSNIISRQYHPPGDLDQAISSLLVGLLEKDIGRRLKGEEVLRHAFFKDIDWNCLNSLRPPYIPVVKGPLDASHFDHYDLNQQTEQASQAVVIDQCPFVGF
jgi:serine/threonine protein kinase